MNSDSARKSVNKGKTGEREFIRTVYRLTDGAVELRRNLRQCRDGGDDLSGAGLFSFEIKRWRRVTDALVRDWWVQAQRNARKQRKTPVLAYRADHQGWKVAMHPNHYFDEQDVRGCMTMDVELFCKFLLDQKWVQEHGQTT